MDELTYQNTIAQEEIVQNIKDLVFNVDDFINQWSLINQTWKTLGFIPHKDNNEMVDDYRYINDCYTRYIFQLQDDIMKNIDNTTALENLIATQATTEVQPPKEGWSPRFVVYICLRNQWLFNIASLIKLLIDCEKGVDTNG